MRFTSLSSRTEYYAVCRRDVPPGGAFSAPWSEAKASRAVRVSMEAGLLAWESGPGEPFVPGSPPVPVRDREAEARAASEAEAARAARRAEIEARMERDNRAVAENMARMGHFNVPSVEPYTGAAARAAEEAPPTEADVISGVPGSLSDILRHNRAVRRFGGGHDGHDGRDGKDGRDGRDGDGR